jgi:hypothetical protein
MGAFVFYLLFPFLCWFLFCSKEIPTKGIQFPSVSGVTAITSGPKEHLFASYYGINSWNKSQRFATVLETEIMYQLPTEKDPALLGLVDMENYQFLPLTQTRAWNFQQGCMAHWLNGSPDSLIIFNDFREGKYVSVIINVYNKKEIKTLSYPVSAVSPNGKEAVSINFSRLRLTRPDYGYGGEGQDAREEIPFPTDDGLFLVNLETGEAKLLVSIAQVKDLVPSEPEVRLEYFNHTLFSRDGSKIFWLARATPVRNTTPLTVNRDGTNLRRCFPDDRGGSHFDWLNGNELMITCDKSREYGHVLFTIGHQDFKRLGKGLLDYDGHGTFSPDGKWMVTDTYPSSQFHEQKLFLMDMETEAVVSLGRFVEPPEFKGYWRCDLHPRWSPRGDMIGFNSTYTFSRQVYIFRLDF